MEQALSADRAAPDDLRQIKVSEAPRKGELCGKTSLYVGFATATAIFLVLGLFSGMALSGSSITISKCSTIFSMGLDDPCFHGEQLIVSSTHYESLQALPDPEDALENYYTRCLGEGHDQFVCMELRSIARKVYEPQGISQWCGAGFPSNLNMTSADTTTYDVRRNLYNWSPTLEGYACMSSVVISLNGQMAPTCPYSCHAGCS